MLCCVTVVTLCGDCKMVHGSFILKGAGLVFVSKPGSLGAVVVRRVIAVDNDGGETPSTAWGWRGGGARGVHPKLK